ncbi:LANO_0G04434g1_1 [Lachancea nothofagi CBS 11611]|uniref:GPI ethanolamine phosphate transferase 1 n=1 Tax=Lachancea nothofagi CBS 11611 TaxID=1266666 RepID=A0A1G4KG42_9SACH|nr:LANO_0G04434g1_1 [Lachancea nothofagi CBS 11611]
MWSKQRLTFVVVGILFHFFYLWSIFDIYFVSPLVHGMRTHKSTDQPPAKRLFLVVGDGLRADTTFENITHPTTGETGHLAPYIRSLVENNATYGVSHTRMPTESRPGHVAMIAGFYEDVSAVTKGWKENPVDFDSFFNQSTHTYSFGSPDILPMFKDGASDPTRVDAWMYGHEFEDFTQSSIELDAFVFKNLDSLFYNSTVDSKLHEEIMQQGNVFFLHLLGCDTAGHSYRPYSAEYYDNVKYIDQQLEKLVPKVNKFFDDEDTAFIFTADHGMSAFGSHGDGHPNNTRTPLVAWGPGIKKPVMNEVPVYDNYTQGWNLSQIKRNDVKQADIASFMSYLIGANYPVNSVGELPLAYIDDSEENKLKALYANARSILEQYLVKEEEIIFSQFHYKQYHKFAQKSPSMYQEQIEDLIVKVQSGDVESEQSAIKITEELMTVTLEGLYYLTTYNRQFTRTIVTLGFVGWITYSFILFLRLFILTKEYSLKASYTNYVAFGILSVVLNYVLYYQKSPFNFYMYLMFPLFFWSQIFKSKVILDDGLGEFFKGISRGKKIGIVVVVLAVYESIVYGFFNRWIFTANFIALGFYPLACGIKSVNKNLFWMITSVCISVFTLFDAVKVESLNQINIASALIILSGCWAIRYVRPNIKSHTFKILVGQVALIVAMVAITNRSVNSLQNREGLPRVAQLAGWFVFVLSMVVMPLGHYLKPNNDYRVRMLVIYLTFAPAFIILTISFESFFYFFFTAYIVQWIEIETEIKTQKNNLAGPGNWLQLLRVSVIGFFLMQIAFFGTGNVASISSFSLDSVYRLMPVFDPFPMGALLVIKLILPFITLSTGLGILNLKLQIKDYSISSLIICTSDILSLQFFFLLKTEGSWLDIGVTISNYCLAILSSLTMLLLEFISHVLLRNVTLNATDKTKKQQ